MVSDIVNSDVVISSSLHGIIVAEAYGFPAIWVRISNLLIGDRHKFLDYFEAFNRSATRYEFSKGLSALVGRAENPPIFDSAPLRDSVLKLRNSLSP